MCSAPSWPAVVSARGRNPVDEIPELQPEADEDPPLVMQVMPAFGLVAAGRREEVRALFPAGLPGIDIDRIPGPNRGFYLAVIAEVAYQLGDADAARSVRDELTPYADRFIVAAGAVGCGGGRSPGCLGCAHSPWTSPTRRSSGCGRRWPATAASVRRRLWPAPRPSWPPHCAAGTGPVTAEEARRLLAKAAGAAAELGMVVLARDIAELQAADARGGS